jgi:hypothetical protein
MNPRKKKILIIIIFFTVLLAGVFNLLKPSFYYLSDYLSKSEQVDANILLVEGWLTFQDLEYAVDEFRAKNYDCIITTGLKATPEYYGVTSNGYLIFYPEKQLAHLNSSGTHKIEVLAFSKMEGIHSAHFNFWINDTLADNFTADKRKRKYSVSWTGPLSGIDSIMIQFDNDKRGEFGDRNLFVKEIRIDHKIIIPYLNKSEYDIAKLDGKIRIINRMKSNAELTKNRLFSLGIDSSLIIAVAGEKVRINRTLTSALTLRDWISSSHIKIKGINIISSGTHARRTWMTFAKVLGPSCKVGIISIPDSINSHSRKRKLFKTVRETAAIIYYWLILLPY